MRLKQGGASPKSKRRIQAGLCSGRRGCGKCPGYSSQWPAEGFLLGPRGSQLPWSEAGTETQGPSTPKSLLPSSCHPSHLSPRAPPHVTLASQNLPGGRKLSDVHVVGRIYISKNVFKNLGTRGSSEAYSTLPHPQDSEVCVILGSSRVPFTGLHWMLITHFCKDLSRNGP